MAVNRVRKPLRISRLFNILFAVILIVSVLSACSSSSSKSDAQAVAPAADAKAENAAKPATAQAAPGNQPVPGGKTSGQTGNDTTSVIKQQGEDGFNRKIIYTANMLLQVKNYDTAQKHLRDLVAGNGAYILNFSESESKSEIGGTYTIKVASDGFVSMLDAIETISKAKQRNVQGQDVTEEFVDLTARLKAKETVEKRLLDFMEKATKSDELLAFSKELATVQEDIERIKGRMRFIEQNVSYSTITVKLVQPIDTVVASMDDDESLLARMGGTISKSSKLLVKFGEGLIIVLTALLPFAIPGAIVAWLIVLWVRRRRRIAIELSRQEHMALQQMTKAIEARNEESAKTVEPSGGQAGNSAPPNESQHFNENGPSDDNVEKK